MAQIDKKILVLDKFNMQSIAALRAKLHRDYLGFFGNLYLLYGPSERRNEIHHIIGKINRLITTIDNALLSNKVTKRDIADLLDGIDDLNESRDVFADEINNIKSLKERVERTTKATGISPQDLNITRDVVKKSAAATIAAQRSGRIGERIRRAAPTAYKSLSEIGTGIKIAALGPFAPIADILGSGIAGVSRWIGGKRRERLERKAEEATRPSGYTTMMPESRRTNVGRPSRVLHEGSVQGATSAIRPGLVEERFDPMFRFFNVGAYKAKWTKELLDRIKGIKGPEEKGASILSRFLPSIATGIGIIAGWKIVEAIKAWRDLGKAEKGAQKSWVQAEMAGKGYEKWVAKEGISPAAQKMGVSPETLIKRMSIRKQQRQKTELAGAPFETKIPIIGGLVRKAFGYQKPKVQALPEIIKEYEQKFKYEPQVDRVKREEGIKRDTEKAVEIMKKLSQSVDNLSNSVRKEKETPNIKPSGVANIYDSADSLINNLATGKLTIR